MKQVTFDARYFRKRMYLIWRAPIIAQAIKYVLKPRSAIDFGCSVGDIVWGLNELHVPTMGVDLHIDGDGWCVPRDMVFRYDLTKPFFLKSPDPPHFPIVCDLGICMETFSVLPEESFAVALENVVRHTRTLLLNQTPSDATMRGLLPNHECDEALTTALRDALAQWRTKPAVKAWATSATVYVPKLKE
jgi:hypothetical protein